MRCWGDGGGGGYVASGCVASGEVVSVQLIVKVG